jgi:hypothetical protein
MMATLGGSGDGYELPYYRIKESRDFRCWQILLQKSVEADREA